MAVKSPTRKRQTRKGLSNVEFDQHMIEANLAAIREGGRKKKWTVHDFKAIKPLTETQRQLFESYFYGNHIVASGSAGAGKTYLAMWLGLQSVFSQECPQEKMIIVRSAVAARDIGFLPGTKEEKMEPFEAPYKDILADLTGKPNSYNDMRDAGKIEFLATSFLRGLTWDNCVVVIDEAQNCTFDELNTVMTRMGKNSRLFVCGDIAQNDLQDKRFEETGMGSMLKVMGRMKNVDVITFTRSDVVRSGFVREWLFAKEDSGL